MFHRAFIKENVSANASTERSIQGFGFGLRDTSPYRAPPSAHSVWLFSVDKNLSDNGETDYEIQQVSSEGLTALSQIGPPNRSDKQAPNGDPPADKKPPQITWFAITTTVVGFAGIVIGIVGFYYHHNLLLR